MIWSDIKTAPKDGTWIWLYRPGGGVGVFERFVIGRWYENAEDGVSAWCWPSEIFDVIEEDNRQEANEAVIEGDCFEDNAFTHWCQITVPDATA